MSKHLVHFDTFTPALQGIKLSRFILLLPKCPSLSSVQLLGILSLFKTPMPFGYNLLRYPLQVVLPKPIASMGGEMNVHDDSGFLSDESDFYGHIP
jgi:hypothetical protein